MGIILQTKSLPVAPSGATIRAAVVADAALTEAEINRLGGQLQTEINTTANAAAAQSAAAIANAAAAAASAAWVASTAPAEILASQAATFFTSPSLVATILYDTNNDSDGGAWRKRCSATSWYNEAIFGKWLGEVANEAAARAVAGATTNDYYHNTSDGLFYALNATTGVTQIYRGNRREFPAQTVITAEVGRVIIWDATQAGTPMWMVFKGNQWGGYGTFFGTAYASSATQSLSILNGQLYIAHICPSIPEVGGLSFVNFVADLYGKTSASAFKGLGAGVVNRNTGAGYALDSGATGLPTIVNSAALSVAMTVLPNAPIDMATGLPIPTIAVATGGGVSVIKDDGAVVNSATVVPATSVTFDLMHRVRWQYFDHQAVSPAPPLSAGFAASSVRDTMLIGSGSQYSAVAVPFPLGLNAGVFKLSQDGIGSAAGVIKYKDGDAGSASVMLAAITNAYNTGWMPGDIRGAWLADSVAETMSGSNLIIGDSSTFNTSIGSWVAQAGASLAVANGQLEITQNTAGVYGQGILVASGLVTGNLYKLDFTIAGTISAIVQVAGGDYGALPPGTYTRYFIAPATAINFVVAHLVTATVGSKISFDNATIVACAADRSIKSIPLTIVGGLTKSAVATGAQLMAYSGFSATSYLEQPYTANLDFGTGDFLVMGWAKDTNIVDTTQILFSRVGGTTGMTISRTTSSGATYTDSLNVEIAGSTGSISTAGAGFPGTRFGLNTPHLITVLRRGPVIEIWFDRTLVLASTVTVGNISGTTPFTRIGIGDTLNQPAHEVALALWRVSATAPSAEQLAYIYESERKLFMPGAQCCLAGNATAVSALAYDPTTDLLHAGTSWGRTSFKGLIVQDSRATTTGVPVAYSAQDGTIIESGTTGSRISTPAKIIRDELRRAKEQAATYSSVLNPQSFIATSAQTTFVLPLGFIPKSCYQQGLLKKQAAGAGFWTYIFDGHRYSVVLGTAAALNDDITILCTRSAS